MANKNRTRKKYRQTKKVETDIVVYMYSFLCIALSIVGALKIGFVGKVITGILQFIFGTLYGVIYGLIIVGCILILFKKSIRQIPMKYMFAIGAFILAWLLACALPFNQKIKGFDILAQYIGNAGLILQGEVACKGGIIGAILVSIFTFLFDYVGTWIFIVLLFLFSLLLTIPKDFWKGVLVVIINMFASFKEWCSQRSVSVNEKHNQNEKSIWDDELESRIQPGQVSFIDVDADFDQKSDAVEIGNPKKADGSFVDSTKQMSEVEEIIGMPDSFESKFQEDYTNYILPPLSLLKDAGKKGKSSKNIASANENGRRLIQILDEFGVKASLIATHIGPTVTKYEIKPDLGVRIDKISNLHREIKMALAAKDIRIEAPIPGKSAVGVEVENLEKTSVSLKDLLKNIPPQFEKSKLMFALGKDLMGNNVYGQINKMPHMLIAGATGSGKSVCINTIITSILMRAKPDEVKLLLIDPKKVEFTPYRQVPHLIGPVITDGDEANRALKVIVNLMDDRYKLFSTVGVRNFEGYNSYIESHPQEQLEKLSAIVVIIDELADLMLVAAKEVEASIQRITQLARAAGIYLIVATQRPSVDVITGIIKANIPSRIAFAVSSAVDSRTILDQMGAEKLLGYGDMLYIPVGESNPTRVQGAFVSDEEVSLICEACSTQAKPKYDDAFLRLEMFDNGISMVGGDSKMQDPLFDEVMQFVKMTRKASTSLIQRKFSIGYARAARIMDALEEHGCIGPARGSKPREVYIKEDLEDA